MSLDAVRAALEQALAAMAALPTAWENTEFTPVVDTPYQRVTLLPAEPDNPEMSAGYQERGVLLIGLCYPLNKGPGDAQARAVAIRSAFPKGRTMNSGGATVQVEKTPEIGTGAPDGECFYLPVRIRWFSNNF